MREKFERALRIRRRLPDFSEGSFKPRRKREPERNSRSVTRVRGVREKGKDDRKVIRKGVKRRGRGAEVRVVVKNGNERREHGAEAKKRRKKEPIEARRPGVGTGGVGREVKVGVFVMGGIHDVEVGFEGGKKR